MYLQRHPGEIAEFVNAIPLAEELVKKEQKVEIAKIASSFIGTAVMAGTIMTGGLLGVVVGAGSIVGGALISDAARDHAIEDSKALKLARRICKNWLLDFEELVPRPVGDVVLLFERLEDHASFKQRTEEEGRRTTILDELEPYLYGWTPMRSALEKSLTVFRRHAQVDQRVLVVVSDGEATDENPLPLAAQLKMEKVAIASIFLTDDTTLPRRQLHDQEPQGWRRDGQRALFRMASKTSVVRHPIPVLASVGWTVPSSGECGLYATVHSTDTLEEFCSILLSARFGSANALLDLVGRVELDAYIDDAQWRTRKNPSRQQGSTCYAHAAAAVLHMALVRIEGREGGCPGIEQIRSRILREFPPGLEGGDVLVVLRTATQWYRSLRIRQVDEKWCTSGRDTSSARLGYI